jgi:predicted DNA-binding transcriptional regulator AlpA
MNQCYYRIKQLTTNGKSKGLLPISRATIFRWVKDGRFPRPKRLGPRVIAWLAADVDDWVKKSAATQWGNRP